MTRFAKVLIILSVVAFVFAVSSFAQQADDEMVKCAVSGNEMKKSEAKGNMEYKGKTYYFCCDNCEKAFKENPEKYINQEGQEGHEHAHQHGEDHMHEHGDDTVVDPVCGMKIKKSEAKATHEYNGKTYYFCMEGCKEKFVKEPAKYVSADENKVKCAVSGSTFNKSDAFGSMEYNGKNYYFCCAGCKEKFEKDPEKYIKKK
ncbi:MAG: YHS domain-containing protein [Candidatus Aminicenantes bacterium]|nr:MAG: YHS domain-containing protein [Candidatus Aminicenantes bacterium]